MLTMEINKEAFEALKTKVIRRAVTRCYYDKKLRRMVSDAFYNDVGRYGPPNRLTRMQIIKKYMNIELAVSNLFYPEDEITY